MMFTARSSAGRLAQVSRHFSTARTLAQQQTQDVYIVGAARTATAKFNGSFATTPAPRLGAAAIKAALERSKLPIDKLSHVYMGNVLSAGMGQSPARQAVIFAGLPDTVEATTINKVCASGLKAVALAANDLALGHGDAAVAGGMENMSLVPRYLARATPPFGAVQLEDGLVKDGLWDVYNQIHMGNCAENTACKLGISRAQQDRYAVESYRRAKAAWAQQLFDEEIVPVEVPQRKGAPALVVREDEEYDAVKLDKIPTLKPAFKKEGGTVTAANASTFSDGASALVLASQRLVDALPALKDSRVFARIVAHADAATAPIDFPLAPTLAIPKVLEQAGLTVADIARWEVNEAFAAVSEANAKVLGYDAAKVNVRGGAIALGHALGSSGSRILVSLLHQLEKGEYGVAAICNGGGAATAMVVQKL